ncbi:phage tail tube protein [Aminipila terrae]|uniref:Terminase n=1 Tax=Aminipila terrae TaxID=2697030 RepID=A0A6P1MKD4_9FIRM|nr:phage tail tube protein [Aminipila terrae]QHI71465.1 terminase [Aminipila terrae]
MINQNRVLSGCNGNVWLNGKLLAQVKSIEAKITGNFEEVNFVGDYTTHHAYTGWAGEGTLVLHKIDSTVLSLVKNTYKTGELPDINIVTQLKDNSTGKSERVSLGNVIITEMMLAKIEGKALVEEEIPFKFSDYDVLETI